MTAYASLPFGDRIQQGLDDAATGTESREALLVCIGWPRLVGAGVEVPAGARAIRDAELRLYALLEADGVPDPYSAYSALLRGLVSFEQALEREVAARRRAARGSMG